MNLFEPHTSYTVQRAIGDILDDLHKAYIDSDSPTVQHVLGESLSRHFILALGSLIGSAQMVDFCIETFRLVGRFDDEVERSVSLDTGAILSRSLKPEESYID